RHPRRQSARSVLVVLEIALALVLLIGAGLMIKSFARLQAVKLGFEPENVLTLTVYSDEAKLGFYKELLARTSALPGVESVSVSSSAPLSRASVATTLEIEGRPSFQGRNDSIVGLHTVSPDYFKTLRITVLKGRGFAEQDRAGAKRVAIINETVARRYWPGEDPLGKRIK